MWLVSLAELDEVDAEVVIDVVRCWCEDHKVPIDSDKGRAAMAAVVDRILSGEKSPTALCEAINAASLAGSLKAIGPHSDTLQSGTQS